MTDSDNQATTDEAVAELTRRLRPWATAMADPEAFARRFFDEWMLPRRWHAPRRPPPLNPPGSGAPPTEEFREQLDRLHRRALNTREDTP